ncbi:unnamed protein product [Lasius platythorax]|uniref:Uncharacterized protein n=1 Tax=Lasius platythorax TaxID=488582 RepID=A0AAV2P454_9HYME
MQKLAVPCVNSCVSGIRRRLRDDRGVNNFCDAAPHVHARADLDYILVVIAGLFPNIVAKCGRACRRR